MLCKYWDVLSQDGVWALVAASQILDQRKGVPDPTPSWKLTCCIVGNTFYHVLYQKSVSNKNCRPKLNVLYIMCYPQMCYQHFYISLVLKIKTAVFKVKVSCSFHMLLPILYPLLYCFLWPQIPWGIFVNSTCLLEFNPRH